MMNTTSITKKSKSKSKSKSKRKSASASASASTSMIKKPNTIPKQSLKNCCLAAGIDRLSLDAIPVMQERFRSHLMNIVTHLAEIVRCDKRKTATAADVVFAASLCDVKMIGFMSHKSKTAQAKDNAVALVKKAKRAAKRSATKAAQLACMSAISTSLLAVAVADSDSDSDSEAEAEAEAEADDIDTEDEDEGEEDMTIDGDTEEEGEEEEVDDDYEEDVVEMLA